MEKTPYLLADFPFTGNIMSLVMGRQTRYKGYDFTVLIAPGSFQH